MKKRLAAAAIAAFLGFVFLFAQGPVQKVRLWDTNSSHSLLLKWNEDRAAAYTMNWIGITADRIITLQGNPTLDDWFDQDYHMIATPTFAGLYLESSTAAPFLKMTNESDTERDPIIQFAVGATPVIKWTMGLDDSDVDKWKLAVGDEFENHHDVIAISAGEGATPPVAEFTLIDSFAATSPRGICEDGDYLYYSDATASQQLVKVDIDTGAEITRSPDAGVDLWNCATDGTHVYVATSPGGIGTVLKYLCSNLSYVSVSSGWVGGMWGISYWAGHLYVTNSNAYNVRKIRCSDMATIWTTSFGLGGGDNNLYRPWGITTDGQYVYVQDCHNYPTTGNNRIVRLNMDGTRVDSVVVANYMGYGLSIALWCAGDHVYNTAYYTSVYKIEKRRKSDLGIAETFSMVPAHADQGCQQSDYHYVVHSGNNFIYKYQYVASDAVGESGIQFRLKDAYGQFNDVAKLTGSGRFGVGTTIPSEKIEAVGNIKATAGQFISTMATGTAPVVVSSTTVCTNLNAGLWDGYHLPALAVGDMIYGDGTPTVAKLADVAAGSYLRSGGVVTAPLWSTLILPNAATAYRLPVATSANTIGELAASGATGEYLKGNTGAIPSFATLNQSAVAGLTTASSPEFVTVKLAGLTDGYVPYHVADATGLANSAIQASATAVGIGVAPTIYRMLYVLGDQAIATGQGYGFQAIAPTRTVAAAETNYLLGFSGGILADGGYHINAGITDSGYRLGMDVNAYVYDTTFKGTLAENYGLRVLHGIIVAGDSGARTITSSYGLYINGLDSQGTITNKYGIYQVGSNFQNYFQGQVYAVGNVSALTFTDRTPYPKDKKEAYDAVLSLELKDGKLDHDKLHPFIRSEKHPNEGSEGGRNLSALVSAQNEVIKDLMARIEALEKK